VKLKLWRLASVLLLAPSFLAQAKVIILFLVDSISTSRGVPSAVVCLLRVGAQLWLGVACCDGQASNRDCIRTALSICAS